MTALFTPLQLQVGVFGTGTVTFRRSDGVVVQPACPAAVGYGDRTCHAAVPADLDVEIDVSPNHLPGASRLRPRQQPDQRDMHAGHV